MFPINYPPLRFVENFKYLDILSVTQMSDAANPESSSVHERLSAEAVDEPLGDEISALEIIYIYIFSVFWSHPASF